MPAITLDSLSSDKAITWPNFDNINHMVGFITKKHGLIPCGESRL